MKILLVNDDGINSQGIRALANELEFNNDLTIVAPQQQMSGMGRSVTLHKGIKFDLDESYCVEAYAVNGTPTDCVKFAILHLGQKPDLLISGINMGANTGTDIHYSGTVGAAMEGSFMGIPSIAISCCCNHGDKTFNYEYIAKFVKQNLLKLYKCVKPARVLNINVPNVGEKDIKGIKVVRQGQQDFQEFYEEVDGIYQLSPKINEIVKDMSDSDVKFMFENFITITPLSHDLTDYERLTELSGEF